jgi:hypothetical protein
VPCRLVAVALALLVAAPVLDAPGAAASGGDQSERGVLYTGRQGEGRVRMVQVGRLRGQPLLLLDVEVECGGLTPEGRGVALVEEGGRFEVVLDATDTDTSDTVTGIFDDIDGRVKADAAVLEIDVDVEGFDNAGSTGDCEETQQWKLRGRPNRGAARIGGATPLDADVVAVGAAGVMALRRDDGSAAEVARIDPESRRTTWQVDAGRDADGLATAGDAVWILDESLSARRLDASTGDEVARVALVSPEEARDAGSAFTPMVATDRAVWIGADGLERLYRVDAATNTVTASVSTPGGVRALAPAPDGVYAAIASTGGGPRSGRLVHFDDAGAEVAAVDLAEAGDALAFDGTAVWAQSLTRAVTRHDPGTLAAQPGELAFPPGTLAEGLAAAAPGVWTSIEQGLLAIGDDLARATMVPVVGAASASSIAAAPDALWVADSGLLVRIET